MDLFFDLLRSVIYGVIEGITEWLPISSTGHMILAEQVLKFSFSAEFMEMFRVVIQLGAILAVVVMYFKKLWPFCVDNGRDSGLAKHVRWPVMRLWFKIIVACLPAAVLGLALDDWIDAHFYNSVVVAVMLIVYGIAFILIERRPRVPTTTKLSRITYRQALIVGAWQVLALIPGTSRSGSTIIGGLLCGMSRACASQFTFFLAIPVMAGASGLKLVKFLAGGGVFTVGEIGALLVGCIVAFVVSILAIRFLMDYVKKHTFTAFGWYRIALGDGLRDLELALTLYPKLRAYSVAGNCDYGALEPTDGLAAFDGVVIFYTHGHMYGVKYDLDTLADAASARGAEVALFGHTHIPHAETRSGVFLFNPGSCGRCYTGPDTYGILTLDGGKVTAYEHKEVPKQ